jgi:hypothetical protein
MTLINTQPPIPPASIKFVEKAEHEKGFAEYYEAKIKPTMVELENMRLETEAKVAKYRPIGNVIFIVSIIVGLYWTYISANLGPLFFTAAFGAVIKTAMVTMPKNAFQNAFKAKILPILVKFFGDFECQNNQALSVDQLNRSKIFRSFNRWDFEDTISGTYRGRPMTFTEADLRQKSGRSSFPVFYGKIIVLETNKAIAGTIVIKQESKKGLMNKLMGKERGLEKVAIPNSQFEEIFEVYSDDQNAVSSILNPDFIQKLLLFNEKHKLAKIQCSYFQNIIVIALVTDLATEESLFEANTPEPIKPENVGKILMGDMEIKTSSSIENIHKFLAQFHSILETLDTLDIVKKT